MTPWVDASLSALLVPLALASLASAGCDIVTADLRSEETAQWHKTYSSTPTAASRSATSTARSTVEPSSGNTVDVTAIKKARGASPEAAKAALERATHREDVPPARDQDRHQDRAAWRASSSTAATLQVEYHVKVPAGAEVKFTTVNGGIEVIGPDRDGSPPKRPTAASPRANIGGQLEASTTNGGLDIDLLARAGGGRQARVHQRRH